MTIGSSLSGSQKSGYDPAPFVDVANIVRSEDGDFLSELRTWVYQGHDFNNRRIAYHRIFTVFFSPEDHSELDLSGLKLTTLPACIDQLTQLKSVSLTGNALSNADLPAISWFAKLDNLNLDESQRPWITEKLTKEEWTEVETPYRIQDPGKSGDSAKGSPVRQNRIQSNLNAQVLDQDRQSSPPPTGGTPEIPIQQPTSPQKTPSLASSEYSFHTANDNPSWHDDKSSSSSGSTDEFHSADGGDSDTASKSIPPSSLSSFDSETYSKPTNHGGGGSQASCMLQAELGLIPVSENNEEKIKNWMANIPISDEFFSDKGSDTSESSESSDLGSDLGPSGGTARDLSLHRQPPALTGLQGSDGSDGSESIRSDTLGDVAGQAEPHQGFVKRNVARFRNMFKNKRNDVEPLPPDIKKYLDLPIETNGTATDDAIQTDEYKAAFRKARPSMYWLAIGKKHPFLKAVKNKSDEMSKTVTLGDMVREKARITLMSAVRLVVPKKPPDSPIVLAPRQEELDPDNGVRRVAPHIENPPAERSYDFDLPLNKLKKMIEERQVGRSWKPVAQHSDAPSPELSGLTIGMRQAWLTIAFRDDVIKGLADRMRRWGHYSDTEIKAALGFLKLIRDNVSSSDKPLTPTPEEIAIFIKLQEAIAKMYEAENPPAPDTNSFANAASADVKAALHLYSVFGVPCLILDVVNAQQADVNANEKVKAYALVQDSGADTLKEDTKDPTNPQGLDPVSDVTIETLIKNFSEYPVLLFQGNECTGYEPK